MEQTSPAVLGPVELPVKPRAWQWLNTGILRKKLPLMAEPGAWSALYGQQEVDHAFRCGFIEGQIEARDSALMAAVEQILNVGHMNTEDLARLRAAWEGA
jgi:hypothetical protein